MLYKIKMKYKYKYKYNIISLSEEAVDTLGVIEAISDTIVREIWLAIPAVVWAMVTCLSHTVENDLRWR